MHQIDPFESIMWIVLMTGEAGAGSDLTVVAHHDHKPVLCESGLIGHGLQKWREWLVHCPRVFSLLVVPNLINNGSGLCRADWSDAKEPPSPADIKNRCYDEEIRENCDENQNELDSGFGLHVTFW